MTKADTVPDILSLLLGHKDWTLVNLSVVTLRSVRIMPKHANKTQPSIVLESSPNTLRIRKSQSLTLHLETACFWVCYNPQCKLQNSLFNVAHLPCSCLLYKFINEANYCTILFV
jgi:hypothetical protein